MRMPSPRRGWRLELQSVSKCCSRIYQDNHLDRDKARLGSTKTLESQSELSISDYNSSVLSSGESRESLLRRQGTIWPPEELICSRLPGEIGNHDIMNTVSPKVRQLLGDEVASGLTLSNFMPSEGEWMKGTEGMATPIPHITSPRGNTSIRPLPQCRPSTSRYLLQ